MPSPRLRRTRPPATSGPQRKYVIGFTAASLLILLSWIQGHSDSSTETISRGLLTSLQEFSPSLEDTNSALRMENSHQRSSQPHLTLQGQLLPTTTKNNNNNNNNNNRNSRTATVMGMATNYGVSVFKRFVGSLRRSGYQGNIILAISPNPEPGVEDYLRSQNVIMKRLTLVNCSTDILNLGANPQNTLQNLDSHAQEVMTCAHPYPDLKVRWGRFALLRDYLDECQECTGPVLVADVRDTFFQRDPFGPEAPPVTGLQVFQEHRTMRTTHWLVKNPVEKCKQIRIFDQPMLCSGTTIGTRDAMLQYLQAMVDEMRIWMKDDNCCCNKMNGDDQSIHNYLYYSGKLPFATAQLNRAGLVHTVGSQGAMIFNAKRKRNMEDLGLNQRQASVKPYTNEEEEAKGNWLGLQYDLTDKEGFFIDFSGERSFIVHQYDRFGLHLDKWLDHTSGLRDP